jgi:plasmid replication initiation protein
MRMGEVVIRAEATAEHGVATIWAADVLIWAVSQLMEVRALTRPVNSASSGELRSDSGHGA